MMASKRNLLLLVNLVFGLSCFLCGTHAAQATAHLIPHGTEQTFAFQNEVLLTDLKSFHTGSPAYRLLGKLIVGSIWNSETSQLLSFELKTPMLSEFQKNPQEIFFLALEDGGKQARFFTSKTKESVSLLNLQRGIVSLFLYRYGDGPFIEQDSSGSCSGFYKSKSSTRHVKTKTACSNWDMRLSQKAEGPLGVAVKSLQVIEYDFSQDGELLRISSGETHSTAVQAKPDVGGQIECQLALSHSSTGDVDQIKVKNLEEAIKTLKGYKELELEAEADGRVSETKANLKQLIKSNIEGLSNEKIGKKSAALLLAKLLPTARVTRAQEFSQILKSAAAKDIQEQLIDLLGATQTEDAHSGFFSVFEMNNETHFDQIERYLQALAVGNRPEPFIIQDLFRRLTEFQLKNEKLKDTLVQTCAALCAHFTKTSRHEYDNLLVKQVQKFIVERLEECESAECREVYIRSLQNLRNPDTIPLLLKYAIEGDMSSSVAATRALQSFDTKHFIEEHRKQFERIFYQIPRKYDSSARTFALDILLSLKPTKAQLEGLLEYLSSHDTQFEVKTYLLQKLRMISEKCHRFAGLLKGILKEKPQINNYHVIGQKGLTTALHRVVSVAPAYNESLLSIQEIFSGVLKRGSVDLILKADKEEFTTFKLGLYTSGLSSYVGGDSNQADPADDSPVTAGMELTVQGVKFRPLVFFNGQAELMSHVWSGTASDPTPAYQATTLMQDHEQYVILQNGATVYLNIIGARSIDLHGKVEFSLWNRNAHTEINQNSGVVVVGSIVYGTSYATLRNDFSLTNEPNLNMVSDVDFYSNVMLCIQLGRPETVLRYSTNRTLNLLSDASSNKKYSNNYSYKLPGNTLALNQKNNEMCNKIFA